MAEIIKISIRFFAILLTALFVLSQSVYSQSVEKHTFSKVSFRTLNKIAPVTEGDGEKIFRDWFGHDYSPGDEEIRFLRRLIKNNRRRIDIYTEEDLKAKFLFPLFNKVNFEADNVTDWYEWTLAMTIGGFALSGRVDCMIAEGTEEPGTPYFMMEFKHTLTGKHPKNQLLSEMLVGMEKGGTDLMRGAFIIGKNWNFVILRKNRGGYEYFISRQFNSLEPENLKKIYVILQAVKAFALQGRSAK